MDACGIDLEKKLDLMGKMEGNFRKSKLKGYNEG
jgi:hypothetical protein